MSNILKLKKWLTIQDAARRLAITFGEDVSEADVLRLGIDGQLQLSVNFVNLAKARRGSFRAPREVHHRDSCIHVVAANETITINSSFHFQINDVDIFDLTDEIFTLRGVYDLPMIGGDGPNDVENKYQLLTGGPSVTWTTSSGVFLEALNGGGLCQLQKDMDDNEYSDGSKAQLKRIKEYIVEEKLNALDAEEFFDLHKEARKVFLKKRESNPSYLANYFPASSLPDDAVLVVRTDALIKFEKSQNGASDIVKKPLLTNKRNTPLASIEPDIDPLDLPEELHAANAQDPVVTPKTEEVPASGRTAAFLAMKSLDAGELSITFVGDKNDLAMGNNAVDVTARGVTKRIPLASLDLVDKRTTILNAQGGFCWDLQPN